MTTGIDSSGLCSALDQERLIEILGSETGKCVSCDGDDENSGNIIRSKNGSQDWHS